MVQTLTALLRMSSVGAPYQQRARTASGDWPLWSMQAAVGQPRRSITRVCGPPTPARTWAASSSVSMTSTWTSSGSSQGGALRLTHSPGIARRRGRSVGAHEIDGAHCVRRTGCVHRWVGGCPSGGHLLLGVEFGQAAPHRIRPFAPGARPLVLKILFGQPALQGRIFRGTLLPPSRKP